MLKFFKSIHWGDKLVDIFVVVFSITIAFWLNNWREDRNNARQERAYLINLSEDLAKDSTNLVEIKEDMKDVFHDIDRILNISPDIKMADSIPIYMRTATSYDYFIFYPEDYTYKTLQQSGDIGLIQSDSIRMTLSHLYDNYQFIDLLKEVAYDFHIDNVVPLHRNYDLRRNRIIDPTLYQTTVFDDIVVQYRTYFTSYVNIINDSMEKHRTLQQLIKAELGNR